MIVFAIRRSEKAVETYPEPEEDVSAPEGEFRRATVAAKNAEIVYTSRSARQPEHHIAYTVVFRIGAEEERYEVDREVFESLYEGQTSTLVTVNGIFFDFGEGKDI